MNAAEHAAEAERLVAWVTTQGNGIDWNQSHRTLLRAQIHATLATIPDTYELTAELDEVRTDPAIKIGDRVVFLAGDRTSKGKTYMGSDSFGTVILIKHGDEPSLARVEFDDIGEQWIGVDSLRVVLGA